jgi:deoxyadenosine/deoxycytidine kinase
MSGDDRVSRVGTRHVEGSSRPCPLRQLIAAKDSGLPSIFDRSLYEDELFVEMAAEDGVASGVNLEVFRSLYRSLGRLLPAPTVLIYLHAPEDELLDRILHRDRPFEKGITIQYLSRLREKYDRWMASYDLSPTVSVDTRRMDFRVDREALGRLADAIRP